MPSGKAARHMAFVMSVFGTMLEDNGLSKLEALPVGLKQEAQPERTVLHTPRPRWRPSALYVGTVHTIANVTSRREARGSGGRPQGHR